MLRLNSFLVELNSRKEFSPLIENLANVAC